ncbi:MAG: shikimate dehydrogenase [Nevskiales bacterium]
MSVDRYAVIGNPVEHSRSPQIHSLFAQQAGQEMQYGRILAPLKSFTQEVRKFREQGGKGLNITLPFKQEAFALCDEVAERARQAEAVNTLVFQASGKIFGDNTDGAGLVADLTRNLDLRLAGKKILLLGAGGAVRGVLGPLIAQQPSHIVIANRTLDKAVLLAEHFAQWAEVCGCGYGDLGTEPFDLIINGTSAGLNDELPPLPDDLLKPGSVAYDMVYAEVATPFVHWGRQHGASFASDGLGMLVEQAAESFLLWRGIRPQTAPVLRALRS